MLNKLNLEFAKLCPKDGGRYTISGMLVEPGHTVVTNGHYMVIVSTPKMSASEFPGAAHDMQAVDTFTPFVLSKQAALDMLKVLPTPSQMNIPACRMIAVAEVPEDSAKPAVLFSNDLETAKIYRTKRISGQFPNWRACMPAADKSTLQMGFSVTYLAQLFAELKTLGMLNITMRAVDNDSAVRFDGHIDDQTVTVVLMPMRAEKDLAPDYVIVSKEPEVLPEAEPVITETVSDDGPPVEVAGLTHDPGENVFGCTCGFEIPMSDRYEVDAHIAQCDGFPEDEPAPEAEVEVLETIAA